jgi:beta-lactam-binding protein with PASTA domain
MYDVLPYLDIEPDYGADGSASADVKVPNLKDMTLLEAKQALEELGLKVKMQGTQNTVTQQIPMANVSVAPGSTVIIYAGDEKPTKTVHVPDMKGMTFRQARAVLEQDGLYLRGTGVAPSESTTIVVASQGITPGSEVAYGTVIQVTLIDNDSSIMESAG